MHSITMLYLMFIVGEMGCSNVVSVFEGANIFVIDIDVGVVGYFWSLMVLFKDLDLSKMHDNVKTKPNYF